ncbi:methyltransferase-like protein 5-like protein [Hyaloraphidium curvatum]|nr:methyltransferase-like protein 5-like protein [Hyaloraphidium curvatum]
MKLKQLESNLSSVKPFQEPNVWLEQYPTPAGIAARVLYTADTVYGDIDGLMVADLGCGCGMLSLGAAQLGASVTGVDIDDRVFETLLENCEEVELDSDELELIKADVEKISLRGQFDTVIMNPPFGTRSKGADVAFLQKALEIAPTVYSLHKTSTREFLFSKAKAWNVEAEVVANLVYDVKASYSFHKKASQNIEVDFWRFTRDEGT